MSNTKHETDLLNKMTLISERENQIISDWEDGTLMQKIGEPAFPSTETCGALTKADLLQHLLGEGEDRSAANARSANGCLPKTKEDMAFCIATALVNTSAADELLIWQGEAEDGELLQITVPLADGFREEEVDAALMFSGFRRNPRTGLIREYATDNLTIEVERVTESEAHPYGFIVRSAYPDMETGSAQPTGVSPLQDLRETKEYRNASPVRKAYLEYLTDIHTDQKFRPVEYVQQEMIDEKTGEKIAAEVIVIRLPNPYDICVEHSVCINADMANVVVHPATEAAEEKTIDPCGQYGTGNIGRVVADLTVGYDMTDFRREYPDAAEVVKTLLEKIESVQTPQRNKPAQTPQEAQGTSDGENDNAGSGVMSPLRKAYLQYQEDRKDAKKDWIPRGCQVNYISGEKTDDETGVKTSSEFLTISVFDDYEHVIHINENSTWITSHSSCNGYTSQILSPFKIEGPFNAEEADLSYPANRKKFAVEHPDAMAHIEYLEDQIQWHRAYLNWQDSQEDPNRIFRSTLETDALEAVALPENRIFDILYYLERDRRWYRAYSWQDVLKGKAPLDWREARAALEEHFPGESVPAVFETKMPAEAVVSAVQRICTASADDPAITPKREKDERIRKEINRIRGAMQRRAEVERRYDRWELIECDPKNNDCFVMIYDSCMTEGEILQELGKQKFYIGEMEEYDVGEQILPTLLIVKAFYRAMNRRVRSRGFSDYLQGFDYTAYTATLDPFTGHIIPDTFGEIPDQDGWRENISRSETGYHIFMQAAKHAEGIAAYSKLDDFRGSGWRQWLSS